MKCILHQWSFVAYDSFSRSWRVEEERTGCSWAHILIGTIQLFKFGTIWTFIDNKILDHGSWRRRKRQRKRKRFILSLKGSKLSWIEKKKYLRFVILFWKRKNAKVMAANIVAVALAALFSLNNIEFSWKWFCKLSFSEAQNLPQQASIHQENCI